MAANDDSIRGFELCLSEKLIRTPIAVPEILKYPPARFS
jgi:hypothetical protein